MSRLCSTSMKYVTIFLGILCSECQVLHSKQPLTTWSLTSSCDESFALSSLSAWPPETSKNPTYENVTTPTTVLAALDKAGVYGADSLYENTNLIDKVDPSVFSCSWIFSTCVTLSPLLSSNQTMVLLELEGINYRANVSVNGITIASSQQMVGTFRNFQLDVTNVPTNKQSVQDDVPDYCISVSIGRAVDSYWTRNATDLAISVVDWSADPPDGGMGIIQPVSIHQDAGIRLRHPTAFVQAMDDANVYVAVVVQVENRLLFDMMVEVSFSLSVSALNSIHCSRELLIGQNTTQDIEFNSTTCDSLLFDTTSQIDINDTLWWPYQMGQPNLQSLNMSVASTGKELVIYDEVSTRVGLRFMKADLDMNGHRLFQVNNQNILIHGGGYAQDLLLRSSTDRYFMELSHMVNMGLNMIRFEGKFPDEALFDLMDEFGILALPGICCCDAWQNWDLWPTNNLLISSNSIESQLLRLRKHPSMAGFLLSSDMLPPANIEQLYRQSAQNAGWFNPIIAAAAEGVSNNESTGVKMLGPYAWVPPSYWSDPTALALYGGPVGFSTEISPGGSPLGYTSWLKTTSFELTNAYCPNQGGVYSDIWNFHCGNQHGVFKSLKYFVPPLQLRYGGEFFFSNHTSAGSINKVPLEDVSSQCGEDEQVLLSSLKQFISYSHLTAYESHRAMFEAYASHKYNATGVIQWMLNNGLPQHIWHLFDWFLSGGGAYYGTQKSHEPLHATFDAFDGKVKVINGYYESISPNNSFQLKIQVLSLKDGSDLFTKTILLPELAPDSVLHLDTLSLVDLYQYARDNGGACLIRLMIEQMSTLRSMGETTLSAKPNIYWISDQPDVVNWNECNFYVCNISTGNNFTMLHQLLPPILSDLSVQTSRVECESLSTDTVVWHHGLSLLKSSISNNVTCVDITLTNKAEDKVAFFIELEALGRNGVDFASFDDRSKVAYFDDNFVTLLPSETRLVQMKVYDKIDGPIEVTAQPFNDIL